MMQPVPDSAKEPPPTGQPLRPVLERIQDLLASRRVPFDLSSHPPVYTSAQAAEVRGESLHSGAKALVVKFRLKTVCDRALGECQRINFNAGSHSESIRMQYAHYLAVEQPTVEVFSKTGAS